MIIEVDYHKKHITLFFNYYQLFLFLDYKFIFSLVITTWLGISHKIKTNTCITYKEHEHFI